MKYSRPTVWMALTLLFVTPVFAYMQGECTAFVKEALAATDKVCADTGRNEACYGHISLDAQPQSSDTPFKFDAVGDRVDVARVSRLRLSPMDVKTDVWGVALLKVQADISKSMPNANVSVLVFGDVELENAIPDPVFADVVVSGPSNANIRRQPSNRAFVVGSLPPTTTIKAKGRSKDGAWLYIGMPEDQGNGWVRRSLVKSKEDLTKLKELDPSLTSYGPMQAFYLQNGKDQTSCENVPNDGILIQTPEGVAQVQLWINEVKIKLGSTAFIQAQGDKKTMSVTTLEGAAHVEALGVEQVAVAGTTVTVRVDENFVPVSPPSLPAAYNLSEVQRLPVGSLERKITVGAPVSQTATYTPAPTFTPSPVAGALSISPGTITVTGTVMATNTLPLTSTITPTIPSGLTATITGAATLPTSTNMPASPTTNTNIPPTVVTNTNVPASPAANTNIPPTVAINTNVPAPPPTNTSIPVPPATNTNIPPTVATNTNVPAPPPTSTSVPEVPNTSVPPPTSAPSDTPGS